MMVAIVPHKSSWAGEFQSIAAELRETLGDLALRIDHIGSTAVPGLDSKDRIDIQVTVKRLDPSLQDALNHLGYIRLEYLSDHLPIGSKSPASQWKKWIFTSPGGKRPANLHVRIAGHANQRYALLFRDYLRSHPVSASAYAELKYRLAKNLSDPEAYPDVKDPAIDLVYYAAEDWAAATSWAPGPSDA